jgi:UDP-2,3-diacylglucosamine pyrophosphatase LpxH
LLRRENRTRVNEPKVKTNPPSSLRTLVTEGPTESLLVLSDVHLGSDLNEQARRDGFGRRSKRIDEDMVHLLAHYQSKKPTGERWRLVIAGDFIDFIGMAIPSYGEDVATEPSEEELEHGLGNASDHARVKMRKVAERHADVFDALADFVAAGHALTLVHGNHDLEFHWDAVKDELRKTLVASAARRHASDAAFDESVFGSRIEFNPWFFYVNGMAYIEHGHQYDAYCATDTLMAPLSPADPRRIARGFCDVLLRFVVRPTRGLKEHGHENLGIKDYVTFGIGLGLKGMFNLARSFARAVIEMFRLRRAYFTEAAQVLKAEHERRIGLLAEATRIGIDRLKALTALQVPPITRSISGILGSVLLDRLALGLIAFLLLVVVGLFGIRHGHAWWGALTVVVAWALGHRYLSGLRKIDPAEDLIERASKLAKLFPAAFVVMGHTHTPVKVPVNEGTSTYSNLGSWAEEEEPAGSASFYEAARTHLVIHPAASPGSGVVAEFLKWDSTAGPRQFVTPEVPFSSNDTSKSSKKTA